MNVSKKSENSEKLARLEAAKIWGREAGLVTLRYFQQSSLNVERKADESPVTIADREAEIFLRDRIAAEFPNDAIVGEEFPSREGNSGWRWILDPIDGTKSFIHGVPLYSTLIGIDYAPINFASARENPVCEIGVIVLPAIDEMLWGARGLGAWFTTPKNPAPQKAAVSKCASLAESLFLTSEVATFDKIARREVYESLEKKCRLTRSWGDAYGYYLVATGRAEIMIDPLMSVWDAAPLMVILEESGGTFTDWNRNRNIDGGNGIGSNGILHDAIFEIVNKNR